jgi:hypothetical protein
MEDTDLPIVVFSESEHSLQDQEPRQKPLTLLDAAADAARFRVNDIPAAGVVACC